MVLSEQLSFFPTPAAVIAPRAEAIHHANLGTFQDSLKAPIHRWFTYPAGFSYKAVEEAINAFAIVPGMVMYDPFAGTGTTNIVASHKGIHSFGVEAHPFVSFVACTKLYWDYDFPALLLAINTLILTIEAAIAQHYPTEELAAAFPELILKCYSREKLLQLIVCREIIQQIPPSPFRNIAKLALTALLRSVADVATGWPYIAPNKQKNTKSVASNEVALRLRDQLYQMYGDLQTTIAKKDVHWGNAQMIAGDARQFHPQIADESIDLCFTSPPYLNNYDYSDRTRLEMYFWNEAMSWSDITEKVRRKLIMSATTQINRSAYNHDQLLDSDIVCTVPSIASELQSKIQTIAQTRLHKGGKKSYDILVAGYFNDMFKVIKETYRILKPNAHFALILGDSAPYGTHIPTDVYLGEIGKAIGFSSYAIQDLRVRGQKWKNNPQRHSVALKESILTLKK